MKVKILNKFKDGPEPGSIFIARYITGALGWSGFQIIEDGPYLGVAFGSNQVLCVDSNPVKSISDLCKEAHQNAIDKGWYEEPRTFGEVIALMHSELSEALEDHRNGYGLQEIYYEDEKPCGIPVELADTVIRIFDTCGHLGIDLEEAIRMKMAYNATRPIRHGGKKL